MVWPEARFQKRFPDPTFNISLLQQHTDSKLLSHGQICNRTQNRGLEKFIFLKKKTKSPFFFSLLFRPFEGKLA